MGVFLCLSKKIKKIAKANSKDVDKPTRTPILGF